MIFEAARSGECFITFTAGVRFIITTINRTSNISNYYKQQKLLTFIITTNNIIY